MVLYRVMARTSSVGEKMRTSDLPGALCWLATRGVPCLGNVLNQSLSAAVRRVDRDSYRVRRETIAMHVTPNRFLSPLILLGLVLVSTVGCTKTFVIRPVQPSQNVYAATTQTESKTVAISDARSGSAKPLSTGTLNVVFTGMDDEIAYLGENLARVLNAAGIKVTYAQAGSADTTLKVLTYRMRNLRTSGFSPYHTFTTFSADLITADSPRRITAYFKNSKVPVWAFREVERPCYQIPLEVIVKEIAAKLNARVFGRVAPTEAVHRLATSITQGPADAASEEYLKVLELGYTNNPEAIAPLVRLTTREETLMTSPAPFLSARSWSTRRV